MREDIKQDGINKYGTDYVKALEFTLNAEGIFLNFKGDKRGQVYKGISRAFNNKWKGWEIIDRYLDKFPDISFPFKKVPVTLDRFNILLEDNLELDSLVFDFYYDKYFIQSGAKQLIELNKINYEVAFVLFDIAVAQGVKRSIKTIQRLLNRYYNYKLKINGELDNSLLQILESICKENKDLILNHLLLEYVDNFNEASRLEDNYRVLNKGINRVMNLRNYLRLIK